MRKLEELQPFIKDDRGRPVPLAYLVGLTYPGAEKAGAASRAVVTQPDHALARELAKMLDDDSPVPAEKREMLAQLVDAVMSPYRTYLRKRKAV